MKLIRAILLIISKYLLKPFISKYKKYRQIHYLYSILKKITSYKIQKIRENKSNNFFVFGRDHVNWSIDQDNKNARYFLKLNKFKINHFIFNSSYVLCVYYDLLLKDRYLWIIFLKKLFNYKIIIYVTNDIRLFEWKIERLRDYVDLWISPSQKIYEFLVNKEINVILIPFYVNEKIFYKLDCDRKKICQKLRIDYEKVKDKIIIGSFQRDSMLSLTKPKEVKNPDLLIKILNKLDKDKFIFLIAGPRRHYIVNQCDKFGIPYLYYGNFNYIKNLKDDLLINKHSYYIINLLYNLSDVYIVSSQFEGGPKAVLEASLTKTLIFSTDVGLAVDFLHRELIYSENNIQPIISIINNFRQFEKKINEYIDFNYNTTQQILTENNYKNLYKKLII